ITATGTPPDFPSTSSPEWPIAVETGKWGISPKGMAVGCSRVLAKAPRPEPSTRPIAGRSAVFPRTKRTASATSARTPSRASSQQHPGDAGGHEVRERPREERAQPEPREVVAALGDERADAADLYADRAEVGEAAEGVGGDRERARVERLLEPAE